MIKTFKREDYKLTTIEHYKARLPKAKYDLLLATLTDSYTDVAAHMSVPTGTVKSRTNRARRYLEKLIEEDRQTLLHPPIKEQIELVAPGDAA